MNPKRPFNGTAAIHQGLARPDGRNYRSKVSVAQSFVYTAKTRPLHTKPDVASIAVVAMNQMATLQSGSLESALQVRRRSHKSADNQVLLPAPFALWRFYRAVLINERRASERGGASVGWYRVTKSSGASGVSWSLSAFSLAPRPKT